jgi:hypothetical protein
VDTSASIASFTVPWGGQQIELQQLKFEAGGACLLRIRIREGRRFTIFDVDAVTALAWGSAMSQWASAQPGHESAARPTTGGKQIA